MGQHIIKTFLGLWKIFFRFKPRKCLIAFVTKKNCRNGYKYLAKEPAQSLWKSVPGGFCSKFRNKLSKESSSKVLMGTQPRTSSQFPPKVGGRGEWNRNLQSILIESSCLHNLEPPLPPLPQSPPKFGGSHLDGRFRTHFFLYDVMTPNQPPLHFWFWVVCQ